MAPSSTEPPPLHYTRFNPLAQAATASSSTLPAAPTPTSSSSSGGADDKAPGFSHSSLGLLLIFLGCFAALLVACVVGHRIYIRRHGLQNPAPPQTSPARRPRRAKERPRMWDVWLLDDRRSANGRASGVDGGDSARWADIMVRDRLPPSLPLLCSARIVRHEILTGAEPFFHVWRPGDSLIWDQRATSNFFRCTSLYRPSARSGTAVL